MLASRSMLRTSYPGGKALLLKNRSLEHSARPESVQHGGQSSCGHNCTTASSSDDKKKTKKFLFSQNLGHAFILSEQITQLLQIEMDPHCPESRRGHRSEQFRVMALSR